MGEEGKMNHILIKDFNSFMYDHILHRGRKHFCRYCLQAPSTAKIFKSHVSDCFKVNGMEMIKMSKKGEYFRLKFMKGI